MRRTDASPVTPVTLIRSSERVAGPTAPRRRLGVAAGLVGLVAVAVSAAGSSVPSLWGDEAASLLSASRPLGSLLAMLTRVDAVHGVSYLWLHAWIAVFGSSPFAIRFPSALAAGLCAAGIVWLCGRFGSVRFAVVAGLLAAVLPRITLAGAEARSYAFAAALATALCVVVAEIVLRPDAPRRWWIAYAGVLAAGVWVFFYLVLMVSAVAVAIALTPGLRARWSRFAVWTGVGLAAAAPIIVAALIEHSQIAFLGTQDAANLHAVLVTMWFGSPVVAVIAWALIGVAAVGWGVDVWRVRRAGAAPDLDGRLEPLAFAWLVVPMGLLLVSNLVIPDYTSRYGTFAAPAAAVVMALGLRRISRLRGGRGIFRLPLLAGVVATALVVAIAPAWAEQRTPYAKFGSDWNEIAQVIRMRAQPGDGIVFDENTRPSLRPRLAMDTDPASFRAVRDLTLKTPYPQARMLWDQTYTIPQAAARGRFDGIDRVWAVEYRTDSAGAGDLAALGYRRGPQIDLHRSTVVLYSR